MVVDNGGIRRVRLHQWPSTQCIPVIADRPTPTGMRPDKLRRTRVAFRNGHNDADEGADIPDIPAGGEPRLRAALPQYRHRQVQRLLHST